MAPPPTSVAGFAEAIDDLARPIESAVQRAIRQIPQDDDLFRRPRGGVAGYDDFAVRLNRDALPKVVSCPHRRGDPALVGSEIDRAFAARCAGLGCAQCIGRGQVVLPLQAAGAQAQVHDLHPLAPAAIAVRPLMLLVEAFGGVGQHGLRHRPLRDGNADLQPVWITHTEETPNGATVRFLVDRARPGDISGLERIVYLFDGKDAEALTEARSAWKASQTAGHAVTYWREDAQGRWQKQA